MTRGLRKDKRRILAISPSSKGFGFAVTDRNSALADWGLKRVLPVESKRCVAIVKKLIARYEPDVLVLQDYWAGDSKRAPRIRDLGLGLVNLAKEEGLKITLLQQKHVYRKVLGTSKGTKRAVAEALVEIFSEQLWFRLPPKRKPWMSEDARMYIFDAVALAVSARFAHI